MRKKILFNKLLASNIFLIFFFLSVHAIHAQQNAPLRRPVSPNKPMWLIHIDTWNYADPQKIIDLIPVDIRPYVVMNISLSISHDVATSQFKVAEYGYEIAKSWLRTCAQNRMWTMIQPSSGGYSQFSDFDLSVYEEFYKEYPNFIGFNYAEQFWGYDDTSDPLSPSWSTRMSHFANLLKLSNQYGGYLSVSWCGNQWSPSINPIGMMKRNPAFAKACRDYTENYILSEKYTQTSYQSDMESICLGSYLSGYSGNYGIRYDDTGWTNASGVHEGFTMATAAAPHFEHMMLTGQTVIDGPELIWTQCFRETNRVTSSNGYTSRNWETFPQFDNTSVDIFRKILDGTVRIPSRTEVIDRTKVVIVNDVQSGTPDDIYSTPETLFEGLYRMDGDGNLKDNKTFFKKIGRYPTIPTVFQLDDTEAKSFNVQINKSNYATKWPTIASKQTELNALFPEEYTGDLYVGRHENGWVTYNPYKTVGQVASASIPFKYNTCEKVELTYSQYTAGIIKEFSNKVNFYLTNYNEYDATLKTDIIKIYGSSVEPTYSYQDRASHQASIVTKNWSGGVLTLTVQHNGPLDLTVNCSGTATGRLSTYTEAKLIEPSKPSVYIGSRQNEAEHFDYKNINSIITGGQNGSIRNYQGQGYLNFGTNAAASIKDVIKALRKGTYQLKIRYTAPISAVTTIDLYVNGIKVATPIFNKTNDESSWLTISQNIELNEGDNEIKLEANAAGLATIYFDNITFSQNENNGVYNFTNDVATTSASLPAANLITVKSGSAGVISFKDVNNNTSNAFKAYSVGSTNGTAVADLDLFQTDAKDYSVTWKEYYSTSGAKKGVLLRATGENGSCPYAVGMKQGYMFTALNNSDGTITLMPYVAGTNGIIAKPTYTTTTLKVMPGQPAWFRASAIGNQLIFECSADGINWEGASQTTFQDAIYTSGGSELVWGLGSNNFNWVMDDIKFSSSSTTISKLDMEGFTYVQGSGPSVSQAFSVSGSSLTGDITVEAPVNYELSLSTNGTYQSKLILPQTNGAVANTSIFVRMASGLSTGKKTGVISVKTTNAVDRQITLTGKVDQSPLFVKYDFTSDVATTSATTPAAINATIGVGNTATAGVVSYTDANNYTSNVIKPYGVGQKNATGVIDLNAFSKTATNYSVTWKQYIGSESTQYKTGVLLRGNTSKIGTASTGYVQGIMEGYLLLVYNTGTDSQFRIYRSTSSGLTTLITTTVSLDPIPNKPIWYRASASGSSSVALKIEYSTDGVNWTTGSSTTDGSSTYSAGATQIVWGLAVNSLDFYMDDIAFSGLDESATLETDDDNDGVPNNIDICPNTPIGQLVNATGCAQTQLDDDGDGVKNNIDLCSNTPSGQSVNANGCAQSQLDDDNDGVKNNIDLCPNTPTGQSVNASGCAQSQLDDDNDGVKNSVDLCPNTPTGQVVNATGCAQSQLDDDNDGVKNNIDLCPNTPSGQSVNASGCALGQLDDDNDGVMNSVDVCPNTPTGQAVNATGCAQSQLDDDNDGVKNNVDLCPNTPTGQSVNASGCAVGQLDDDGDGVKNSVDLCPNTPVGQPVDANGCIALGSTNYSIEVVSESCPNKNNGQITITANQNLTYTATVNGVSKAFSNKILALTNLNPGTYDICIEASGTSAKQCYSVVIPASAAITAKTTSTSEKLMVEIQSGTAPYQVNVNGVLQFETNNSNFGVDVSNGDVLEVTTSKECEGTYAKTITLFDLVKAVPNPTTGPFDLYLPTNDSSVEIGIYTVTGTLISKSVYTIENGKVHLDLGKEAAGIYFVRIQSNPLETIKIIKK